MLKFSYLRKCFKIWGFLKYIETNVKIVHFQNARNIAPIFVSASRKLWHWEGYIEKSFRIRTVAADAAKQQANQQLPLQGRGSKVSSGRRLPKIEAKSSRVVGYTAAAGWSGRPSLVGKPDFWSRPVSSVPPGGRSRPFVRSRASPTTSVSECAFHCTFQCNFQCSAVQVAGHPNKWCQCR